MPDEFTHLDRHGHAAMVDVTNKAVTHRRAIARARVQLDDGVGGPLVPNGGLRAAVEEARLAGVVAAGRTASLIPLCHTIPLESVTVNVEPVKNGFRITARTETYSQTGVEMEALTAVTVTALTLVGLLHKDGRMARVDDVALWEKTGGRSGTWRREASIR